MKKLTIIGIALIVINLVTLIGGLVACGSGTTTPTQTLPGTTPTQTLPGTSPTQTLPGTPPTQTLPGTPPTQTLPAIEVREYEGQDLSSTKDFSENSIKGPQYVDINNYQLQVTGLVDNTTNYTYDEVINDYPKYKKVVELNCVEGWSVNLLWEGVQLKDILEKAGPRPEAKVVIFHAYDGYTTSFPIEYIVNNNILMAYKMNDIIIPPERGFPFQLVAESKWGYKWIKWITQIELSDNINYKGYWEERGYSNSGDLDKWFLAPNTLTIFDT